MAKIPQSNLPANSQPWRRWIEANLVAILAWMPRISLTVLNNNKAVNSNLNRMSLALADLATQQADLASQQTQILSTIAALPVTLTDSGSATNFSTTSTSLTTKATATVTVPAGKTRCQLIAVGGASIADTTTGGVATSSARIVINGTNGSTFAASKDAGASVVNNILTPSFSRSMTGLTPGAALNVTIQLAVSNAGAFPAVASNMASVNIIAIFTP